MTDNQPLDPKRLDDELAEFTDRMLDDEAGTPEVSTQNQELGNLQNTVARLKHAFGTDKPDEAMAGRIRANLVKAWQESGPAAQRETGSPRRRWRGRLGLPRLAQRQVYAFSALVTVLLVGALILLLSPDTSPGDTLTGAAQGQSQSLPAAILAGVALAGMLWWLARRRKP